MSETTNRFVNRTGEKLNYRVLKVEEVIRNDAGEISELVVSVERADEEETSGTKLNAENLNTIINSMIEEIKNKAV